MMVLRKADGSDGRFWLLCAVVCSLLVTVVATAEASGQGESTYDEEYDDEGPYHRGYELPDRGSLEDFDDPVQYDVLDPLTDDDISYSGYYDEVVEPEDGTSTSTMVSGLLRPNVVSGVGEDLLVRGSSQPAEDSVTRGQAPHLNETTIVAIGDDEYANGTTLEATDDVVQTTTEAPNCDGYKELAEQPHFDNPTVNFIRKCCPDGKRLVNERSILYSCQHVDKPKAKVPTLSAIVARFYEGCIEDREEEVRLGFSYGNPCSMERGLVRFGARTNDSLYVIQNGSLLVVYGIVEDYEIFDTYCLDYDDAFGSLVGYVCPEEVNMRIDLIAGQLFLLKLCLVFAVPLLLLTAYLYMVVKELHDLHGRVLAMHSLNFAIALLLEAYFQHKARGKRMLADEVQLESYAEYFILATFFWLMANCVNNCSHAWYYALKEDREKIPRGFRFIIFALVAQLLPLVIILSYSTTPEGYPAMKHYFFKTIMAVLVLTLICQTVCYVGVRRLKHMQFVRMEIVVRIMEDCCKKNTDFPPELEVLKTSAVETKILNKVIYMTNCTTFLFLVMAVAWSIMTFTYYTTFELPIFYDILFGLQGILMFVLFVCSSAPRRAILAWWATHKCNRSYSHQLPESPAPRSMVAPLDVSPMRRLVTSVQEQGRCMVQIGRNDILKLKQQINNPFTYVPE